MYINPVSVPGAVCQERPVQRARLYSPKHKDAEKKRTDCYMQAYALPLNKHYKYLSTDVPRTNFQGRSLRSNLLAPDI